MRDDLEFLHWLPWHDADFMGVEVDSGLSILQEIRIRVRFRAGRDETPGDVSIVTIQFHDIRSHRAVMNGDYNCRDFVDWVEVAETGDGTTFRFSLVTTTSASRIDILARGWSYHGPPWPASPWLNERG